jgi:hypothetical protein
MWLTVSFFAFKFALTENLLDATYLLKSLQGFKAKGITAAAISIQVFQLYLVLEFAQRHPLRRRMNQRCATPTLPETVLVTDLHTKNNNPTYPTCAMTPSVEGQIGNALRTLLNNNGFSATKIIGYEHNWNNAGAYPVQLVHSCPLLPIGGC